MFKKNTTVITEDPYEAERQIDLHLREFRQQVQNAYETADENQSVLVMPIVLVSDEDRILAARDAIDNVLRDLGF